MITMNIFCPFLCSLTAVWSTWDAEPTWILKKRLCIVDDLSVRNGDAMWLAQEDSRDTIACARMIRQRKYLKFTDLGAVYLIADLMR